MFLQGKLSDIGVGSGCLRICSMFVNSVIHLLPITSKKLIKLFSFLLVLWNMWTVYFLSIFFIIFLRESNRLMHMYSLCIESP